MVCDWFAKKRQSEYTFPRELTVQRERKPREEADAVSVDEASYHLDRALANSKWAKIRGWHVFRHSFASNAAAAGIDQRVISAWMGHTTQSMEQRFRHLFPNQAHAALQRVFGNDPIV